MAFQHGKDTTLLVDQYDLSAYLQAASKQRQAEVAATTTFGKVAKTFVVGAKSGTASFTGFFDGAVNAVDAVLAAALGNDAGLVMTIARQGVATIGNILELLKSKETAYEVSGGVDGPVEVTAEAVADGDIDRGVLLHPLTAETATGNDASVDNTVASTNGGVAHQHVTAKAGTAPTLTTRVQHSVDNVIWVDLVTFAALSDALGKERVEVAAGTTVNRYVRSARTIGGTAPSWTYAVGFARR